MNTNEGQNPINATQGNVNVAQPGVQAAPVNPVTATPVQPVTPTVAPQAPVAPTPMPAQAQPVTPQPMPAPAAPSVTPTPVVVPQPEVVSPTPVQTAQPEQAIPVAPPLPKTAPQVVMPSPQAAPTVVDTTTPGTAANAEEVTVISTAKSRTSNIVLILVVALLIGFVFNIDKAIEIYETYTQTGSLTPTKTPTDNVTDGFVMIDDNSSSIKVEGIKFYNFKKASGQKMSFTFESETKYTDAKSLGIYVEIYNSNKELIFKHLFNPNATIESNTVRVYNIDLTNEIYESIFYAKVKKYTEEEENSTSTLVCKLTENDVNYTNTFNFKNNVLNSYDVKMELANATKTTEENTTVEATPEEKPKAFQSEYDKVKDITTAKLDDNSLSYTIDVTKDYETYTVLYTKDATKVIIKNKEELKKWTCE